HLEPHEGKQSFSSWLITCQSRAREWPICRMGSGSPDKQPASANGGARGFTPVGPTAECDQSRRKRNSCRSAEWWAHTGSNLGPLPYEPQAIDHSQPDPAIV